jgi:hypothetical protein
MARAVSVELDDRLERFIEQAQRNRHLTPPEVSAELMQAGYRDLVRQLHHRYLNGEITLRAVAQELGLGYRELYALLEELNLPIA